MKNNNNNDDIKMPANLLNALDEVHKTASSIFNSLPQAALSHLPNNKKTTVSSPVKKTSSK